MSTETIDLTWNFLRGTIKHDLAVMPAQMMDAAVQVLDEGADLIVGLAKTFVHVDTGTLQKSIRKERGGEGLHWRQLRVRAGGYFINPKTGLLCNYAVHQEQQFPYMRPAVEIGRGLIIANLSTHVRQAVTSR